MVGRERENSGAKSNPGPLVARQEAIGHSRNQRSERLAFRACPPLVTARRFEVQQIAACVALHT